MFSNKYIFTYASVMVILVAAILSSASMLLKPYQEANVKAEKIQGILASANVTTDRDQAANTYQQHIVEELAVDLEGNVVSRYRNDSLIEGDVRPFDIDVKEALMRKQAIKRGESTESPLWPIFVLEKDGKKYYIVPVRGVGLWGPIWEISPSRAISIPLPAPPSTTREKRPDWVPKSTPPGLKTNSKEKQSSTSRENSSR